MDPPLCLLVIGMLHILDMGLVMDIVFNFTAVIFRLIVYLGVGVTRLHQRLVWHILSSPARGYQAMRKKLLGRLLISAMIARRAGSLQGGGSTEAAPADEIPPHPDGSDTDRGLYIGYHNFFKPDEALDVIKTYETDGAVHVEVRDNAPDRPKAGYVYILKSEGDLNKHKLKDYVSDGYQWKNRGEDKFTCYAIIKRRYDIILEDKKASSGFQRIAWYLPDDDKVLIQYVGDHTLAPPPMPHGRSKDGTLFFEQPHPLKLGA